MLPLPVKCRSFIRLAFAPGCFIFPLSATLHNERSLCRRATLTTMSTSTTTTSGAPQQVPVPRPSASLVIVNQRNEILLVERNPKSSAFAGMHVRIFTRWGTNRLLSHIPFQRFSLEVILTRSRTRRLPSLLFARLSRSLACSWPLLPQAQQ